MKWILSFSSLYKWGHWGTQRYITYLRAHSFFFFKIFFLCGPFLKFLLNFLQYCFCFIFCFLEGFFWLQGMWDPNPLPGIEPPAPELEGEVLTTGPLGKVPHSFWVGQNWSFFRQLIPGPMVHGCLFSCLPTACLYSLLFPPHSFFPSCGDTG